MYLDAGHSGWLGWCGSKTCKTDSDCKGSSPNMGLRCIYNFCECDPTVKDQGAQKYAKIIAQIFSKVGRTASDQVRGFASNTANYQPLGYPNDIDSCNLTSQYNFAYN